jgi:hypothetical protein
MYASKIITELVVSMVFLTVNFSVQVTPAVIFPVFVSDLYLVGF